MGTIDFFTGPWAVGLMLVYRSRETVPVAEIGKGAGRLAAGHTEPPKSNEHSSLELCLSSVGGVPEAQRSLPTGQLYAQRSHVHRGRLPRDLLIEKGFYYYTSVN